MFQVIYEQQKLLQWEMVSGIYCHGLMEQLSGSTVRFFICI